MIINQQQLMNYSNHLLAQWVKELKINIIKILILIKKDQKIQVLVQKFKILEKERVH